MATRKSSDPVERVLRLFTILQLVASRRPGQKVGRADLARACECSIKTAGRAVDLLQLAHVPIDYDKSASTYLLPEKGWSLTTSTLTASDVLMLALLRSLLADDVIPVPFAAHTLATLDKILLGLPPVVQPLSGYYEAPTAPM